MVTAIRDSAPDTENALQAEIADKVEAPGMDRWLDELLGAVIGPEPEGGLTARLLLPDQPQSVRDARAFVTELLTVCGLEEYAEPVRLVVSELVANAMLHVRSPCALEVTVRPNMLRIGVADAGSGLPQLQALSPASERGRGLHLVSAFSSSWGADPLLDGGKLVWAQLAPVASGLS
jgi:anti-sigma regulatory factor (Ser/Thr protein kinase)